MDLYFPAQSECSPNRQSLPGTNNSIISIKVHSNNKRHYHFPFLTANIENASTTAKQINGTMYDR